MISAIEHRIRTGSWCPRGKGMKNRGRNKDNKSDKTPLLLLCISLMIMSVIPHLEKIQEQILNDADPGPCDDGLTNLFPFRFDLTIHNDIEKQQVPEICSTAPYI